MWDMFCRLIFVAWPFFLVIATFYAVRRCHPLCFVCEKRILMDAYDIEIHGKKIEIHYDCREKWENWQKIAK